MIKRINKSKLRGATGLYDFFLNRRTELNTKTNKNKYTTSHWGIIQNILFYRIF